MRGLTRTPAETRKAAANELLCLKARTVCRWRVISVAFESVQMFDHSSRGCATARSPSVYGQGTSARDWVNSGAALFVSGSGDGSSCSTGTNMESWVALNASEADPCSVPAYIRRHGGRSRGQLEPWPFQRLLPEILFC
jgi:hypothetical protein